MLISKELRVFKGLQTKNQLSINLAATIDLIKAENMKDVDG